MFEVNQTVRVRSGVGGEIVAEGKVVAISPSARKVVVEYNLGGNNTRPIAFWKVSGSTVWRRDPGTFAAYLNDYIQA